MPRKVQTEASTKKISKSDLDKLLSQWSKEYAVFVPSREGDSSRMAEWDGEDIAFLDWYRNTIVPP